VLAAYFYAEQTISLYLKMYLRGFTVPLRFLQCLDIPEGDTPNCLPASVTESNSIRRLKFLSYTRMAFPCARVRSSLSFSILSELNFFPLQKSPIFFLALSGILVPILDSALAAKLYPTSLS